MESGKYSVHGDPQTEGQKKLFFQPSTKQQSPVDSEFSLILLDTGPHLRVPRVELIHLSKIIQLNLTLKILSGSLNSRVTPGCDNNSSNTCYLVSQIYTKQ